MLLNDGAVHVGDVQLRNSGYDRVDTAKGLVVLCISSMGQGHDPVLFHVELPTQDVGHEAVHVAKVLVGDHELISRSDGGGAEDVVDRRGEIPGALYHQARTDGVALEWVDDEPGAVARALGSVDVGNLDVVAYLHSVQNQELKHKS